MTELTELKTWDKAIELGGYRIRRPHQNTWSVVPASIPQYKVEEMVLEGNSPVKFFYTVQDVETFLSTGKVENTSSKPKARRYSQSQLAYYDSINPSRESGLNWER